MAIVVQGHTNYRSTTTTARGAVQTYLRNETTEAFNTLLNSTSITIWTTSNVWGLDYIPSPSTTNQSTWTLGPAGVYPYELNDLKGRFVLRHASGSDATSPAALEGFTINSQNFYLNYSFENSISLTSGNGSGTIITVASTAGLQPGMWVSVSAGTGSFAANTYVNGVLSPTQFRVNAAPSVALSGATITAAATNTAANGSSSGTTITVTSTAGLLPNATVVVTSGTGAFAADTFIVSIDSLTQFTVSASPATPLSGATITAYYNTFGWRTSTSNTSSTTTAWSGSAPVGLATTALRWIFTNTAAQMGAGIGPSAAQSGSYWLLSYYTSSGTTNMWLFTPSLPLYPGPWQVNYQRDAARNTFYLGRRETAANASTTIAAPTLPAWVTSPSYSIPTMTGASSSGTTVTVTSIPPGLQPGASVTVISGTGSFATDTTIIGFLVTSATFSSGGSVNSISVVLTNGAGIVPGLIVSGTGVPVNTTVTSVTFSGTTATITVSNAFNVQATGTYSFFNTNNNISNIISGTTFLVSQTPTVTLSGATILLANISVNNGLPPGLTLNSSTGEITGTLDVSGLSSGLTDYRFCIRCDFTFSSTSHSYTGVDLAGANTANFEYEVIKTDASLESAIPDIGPLGDELVVAVTTATPSTVTYSNVQEMNTPQFNEATKIPPSIDPRKTPVIIIG